MCKLVSLHLIVATMLLLSHFCFGQQPPPTVLVVNSKEIKPNDTITLLYPMDFVTLQVYAIDEYGNRIGWVVANWVTTGTLHVIDRPDSSARIFYQSSNSVSNEEGYIHALPLSNVTTVPYGSVYIKIVHPESVIVNRITKTQHKKLSQHGIFDLSGKKQNTVRKRGYEIVVER